MEAELTNVRTRHIYIDSNSGDAFHQALIGEDSSETIAIEYVDYGDADSFRLPHEVRYVDGTRFLPLIVSQGSMSLMCYVLGCAGNDSHSDRRTSFWPYRLTPFTISLLFALAFVRQQQILKEECRKGSAAS